MVAPRAGDGLTGFLLTSGVGTELLGRPMHLEVPRVEVHGHDVP